MDDLSNLQEITGLGIRLVLVDEVSGKVKGVVHGLNVINEGLDRVEKAATRQVTTVQNLSNAYLQLFAVMQAAQSMQVVSQWMQDFGKDTVGLLYLFGKTLTEVGGQFDQYMVQLTTIFKGNRLAAEKELEKVVVLARETTADVRDVVSGAISLRLRGMDPFAQYGEQVKQDMISWAADLAASLPGKTIEDAIWSIGEAVAGQWRSLRNRFNIGTQDFFKVTGKEMTQQLQGEEAVIALAKYMEEKGLAGLQRNMAKTLPAIIQNIIDVWSILQYKMADMGIYDAIIKSFNRIYDSLVQITSDESFEGMMKGIADAVTFLWRPVDKLIDGLLQVLEILKSISRENPELFKGVAIFLAIAGAVTFASGTLLSWSAGLLQTAASLAIVIQYGREFVTISKQEAEQGITMLTKLMRTLRAVGLVLFKFVALSALMYIVWSRDIGEIRTKVIDFVNKLGTALREASEFISMPINSMQDLNRMSKWASENVDTLAGKFAKLGLIMLSTFSLFTKGEISAELMEKIKALGIEDTVTSIAKAVWQIEQIATGIVNVFSIIYTIIFNVVETISNIISSITNVIREFFGLIIIESERGASSLKWLGNIIGIVLSMVIGNKFINGVLKVISLISSIIGFIIDKIKLIYGYLDDIIKFIGKWGGRILTILGGVVGSVWRYVGMIVAAFASNPIAAAIMAVIALLIIVMINFDKIKEAASKAWEAIKNNETVKSAIEFITNKVEKLKEVFDKVKDAIQRAIEKLKEFLGVKGTTNLGGDRGYGVFVNPPEADTGGKVKESGLAVIHKDERVLSAEKTKEYEDMISMSSVSNRTTTTVDSSINNPIININIPEYSSHSINPRELAQEMLREFKRLKREDDMRNFVQVSIG